RNVFAQAKESVLQRNIVSFRVIATFSLMMKISTAYLCVLIVAYSKPYLRLVSFLQVIRCTLPAHLCRNPTWINCIGINLWPFPRYPHAKHQHMQLRIGVGDTTNCSIETLQFRATLHMHAGTQVDQSLWGLYEAGKNIGCQC